MGEFLEKDNFVIEKIPPFWKIYRREEVLRWPLERRKEAFLKWKWGEGVDFRELEFTRRYIIQRITPNFLARDEAGREYWKSMIRWEARCNEIREELGLEKVFIPGMEINEADGKEQTELSFHRAERDSGGLGML
jgi:hypothetical protein